MEVFFSALAELLFYKWKRNFMIHFWFLRRCDFRTFELQPVAEIGKISENCRSNFHAFEFDLYCEFWPFFGSILMWNDRYCTYSSSLEHQACYLWPDSQFSYSNQSPDGYRLDIFLLHTSLPNRSDQCVMVVVDVGSICRAETDCVTVHCVMVHNGLENENLRHDLD